MPTEESPVGQNLLSHYGVSIAEYHGEGALTLKDGETANCKFEAGQLATGEVLLLCDFMSPLPSYLSVSADKFEGMTFEGFRIFAKGTTEKNYLPDLPRDCSGHWAAFRLREMSVQMTKQDVKASKVHFGVTNFEFMGTEKRHLANSPYPILPLSLNPTDGTTELSITPLEQYNSIMKRIKTLKSIDVTCEIVGDIPKDGGVARLTEIVENLCYLLSVARGTKVQWIYRDLRNGAGKPIQRTHCSRITKPFCPLPIIDPRPEGRDETKTFIEQSYPVYVEKRDDWRLNRGAIDAYLDARMEQDYLQMRGVKLVVAMEMLKSVFLDLPDSPVREYVINETDFEKLIPSIKAELDKIFVDNNINRSYREAIYSAKKVEGLNRRSFRHILGKLCKHIGLQVTEEDIEHFITCRNKLIHRGRFYCEIAKPEEREKCEPLPSPADEYFFLLNFLDRIFLKLLGFSGQYINYRLPWPPRKEQV